MMDNKRVLSGTSCDRACQVLSPSSRASFGRSFDGLLDDARITVHLRHEDTPGDAAWSLLEAANAAGGHDNTSIVVIDVAS